MKTTRKPTAGFVHLLWRHRSLASALFSGLLMFSPTAALAEIPRGVFSIAGPSKDPAGRVLSNPDVDGVSLRQSWSEIEPVEGQFNFDYLDNAVALCAANGKQVLIRISTQAGKPAWVTNAVKQHHGKFFTFSDNGVQTKIPVFWDPTFLEKKTALIRALGARFSGNPAVTIIVASFANATSEDWVVPHTPLDITNWLRLGYTTDLMLATGKTILDTTMDSFPNQFVTMAVGGNGSGGRLHLDPSDDFLARSIIQYGRDTYGERMFAQRNNLSATIPDAPGTGSLYEMIWYFQPEVAGQMVGICITGDVCGEGLTSHDALMESIQKGLGYGQTFIEIYSTDVINFPDVITWAHEALLAQ